MPQSKTIRSPKTSSDNGQLSQKSIAELFAASKHKVVDSSASSPNKRLKRGHPRISDELAEQVKPMTIRAQDMYTFNSSSPKTNGGVIDLTISPTGSPKKPAQRRPANFTPHIGTKKLVVKNFRTTPRASPDQYANQVWTQLETALSAIFRGEDVSLEELYRGVENVCRQDKAQALFQKLCEKCNNHVTIDLKALATKDMHGASAIDVLRATIKAWTLWKEQLVSPACSFL